jgi:uncharacterized protein YutD
VKIFGDTTKHYESTKIDLEKRISDAISSLDEYDNIFGDWGLARIVIDRTKKILNGNCK